jgi:hypothetical protein
MNTKNTATATKSRIAKRIGRLAVAAAAATALALGIAPSAHAVTAREALDKMPLSCNARVVDDGEYGYTVDFYCPGPPPVIIVCVNNKPCEIMRRVKNSGPFDAKAPTQTTAIGPSNSDGNATRRTNEALSAATDDAVIRQIFASKTSVNLKAPIAATTQEKSAPTVK